MIEARGLTKRYGRVLAVDGLSFDVRPGVVTGFLGPNSSGKSTMRLMLGLDATDGGMVRIGGRRYRDLGWYNISSSVTHSIYWRLRTVDHSHL